MEIRIIATSYNFLTKEELLIKDGIGHLLNDNYLTYVEDFEDNNARHEIKWNDDEILLIRSGSGSSIVSLKLNQFSTCKVNTMYGEMEMKSFLVSKDKNDFTWNVEYKLFMENDLIAHTDIIWEIEGVNDESIRV